MTVLRLHERARPRDFVKTLGKSPRVVALMVESKAEGLKWLTKSCSEFSNIEWNHTTTFLTDWKPEVDGSQTVTPSGGHTWGTDQFADRLSLLGRPCGPQPRGSRSAEAVRRVRQQPSRVWWRPLSSSGQGKWGAKVRLPGEVPQAQLPRPRLCSWLRQAAPTAFSRHRTNCLWENPNAQLLKKKKLPNWMIIRI